jgi:hypothetical protein
MKVSIFNLISILALTSVALAQDVAFDKTRYSSVKQPREIDVTLTVSDSNVLIESKPGSKKDRIAVSIPFTSIDAMSYELATRHRVSEGAGLMAISLGAGAVVMATKTKSHWLAIQYREDAGSQTVVLRLDKSQYQSVISTLQARTGKHLNILESKTSPLNPTAGSKDMDEVVAFSADQVAAALKSAMENEGCKVTEATASQIECKRARGVSERTGAGGEKVTATLEASGEGTHIRIWTGKGFVGRASKKNWSMPIYQEIVKRLQGAAQLAPG